jgi:type VI secretion system secreted protein VgrG
MQDGAIAKPAGRHLALHCSLETSAIALRSMAGHEQLGGCFEYTLTLYSLDHDLDLGSLLGQHVTVEAKLGTDPPIYFDGIASSFSHVGSSGRHALYRLALRPWLWLLSTNREFRVFQRQTALEIVELILSDWGFSDVERCLVYACPVREYCVQYGESDLHFISRLFEDEGIYYFFRHELGKHTLVLADSASAHRRNPGYELLRVGRIEAHETDRSLVFDWSSTRQLRPSRVAINDYDFTKPDADLYAGAEDPEPALLTRAEIYEYPGDYREQSRGQDRARVRIEELMVEQSIAHGATHGLGLHAGVLFELAGHPRSDQNKEYLVLSANYQLDAGSYESGDASHANFCAQFKALDSRTPFRPWRAARPPRIPGPQTARVVGPETHEIWTDKYGRVKVQFHWDRDGKFNENSSCWVRVAQLWAGDGWGAMHVPRIGQEVIVEFFEGNPDQPLITGRVYNGKNTPPYELPANKTQSGIKTRSTQDGNPNNFNELRFEDKKGEELVYLQAERDLREHIKHDHSSQVGGAQSLSVTGNRTLHVHGSQAVSIDGSAAAAGVRGSKLDVTGDYQLDASKTIYVQTPKSITLQCGGSSISIEPGKIVIQAGGHAAIVLDADALITSSRGVSVQLDQNLNAATAAGSTLALDAMSASIASGASHVSAAKSGVSVTGPTVNIG